MDFKVIYKDTFLEDFERILRSIAAHNHAAARKLGLNTLRLSESLSSFPERYPRVRGRPSVRRFVVQRHFKVFYRVQPGSGTVEILRFWDGRRGSDPFSL
jgi:plasmid stabilization system protein ParE